MTIFYYILIAILVIFSAFFSGSEIALASCNKFRLSKSADSGIKRAKKALYLNNHYSATISTILVGNNLVNILASSTATIIALNWTIHNKDLYITLIMTVVILICGEIVPKSLCNEYADNFTLFCSYPLRWLMIIFYPIVSLVSFFVEKISVLWKPKEEPTLTQEELYTALEEIEDEGVFSESESELIKSAIEFTDITAHEILIPRVDVVAFNIEDGIDALLNNEDILRYSRFPVYRESMDNIIGILSGKRLMRALMENDPSSINLEELLYKPLFVHKTMAISSIINNCRRLHAQMAVVVDEFGGTLGILTMEDIVEEIVGDIFDETDSTEEEAIMRSQDTFEIDGSMNLYDLFDLVGYEPDDKFECSYNTAGGWATEMLDRFPQKGDSFTFQNLTVDILKAQSMRVDTLLVKVNPPIEEEG